MHDVAFVNAHLATMSHGDVRDGVLAATGERISWAGSHKEWRDKARIEHDARGAWITPALIDCHTHLVYAGNGAGVVHFDADVARPSLWQQRLAREVSFHPAIIAACTISSS